MASFRLFWKRRLENNNEYYTYILNNIAAQLSTALFVASHSQLQFTSAWLLVVACSSRAVSANAA